MSVPEPDLPRHLIASASRWFELGRLLLLAVRRQRR